MRIKGSVIFTGLMALFFLVFGIAGTEYIHNAWIYPVFAGLVGFVVTVLQLVQDLKAKGEVASSGFDLEAERSVPNAVLYRRVGKFAAWIIGYYIAIWLIGFKMATAFYFILFMRLEGNSSWRTTILLCGIMFAFLVVFEILLGLYWPDNLLQRLVNLPYLN